MTEQTQQQFQLQRIYVKDVSFETPQGHEVFRQQWKPRVNLEMNTKQNRIDDSNYEVVLTLSVTASQEDKTAFLAEVQQAGIFFVAGIARAAAAPGAEHRMPEHPVPLRARGHRQPGDPRQLPSPHARAGELRRAVPAGGEAGPGQGPGRGPRDQLIVGPTWVRLQPNAVLEPGAVDSQVRLQGVSQNLA